MAPNNALPADEVFEAFEIEFNAGESPIFHGGELITGALKINLKKQITINVIRLQFRGRAVFGNNKDQKSGDAAEKIYFDKDFVLLERPPGHPEPGHFPWNANFTYSLPFECPLPNGCETSYESPVAYIRYYARAVLITDEAEPTQYMAKKAFSVVSPPELNHLIPPNSDPVSKQDVLKFGGCCCRGKLSAEVSLPKSAYAPGEHVVGTFTVDNRHSRNVLEHQQIEVRLVDHVERIVDPSSSTTVQEGEQAVQEKAKSKKKRKKEKAAQKPAPNHRVVEVRRLESAEIVTKKKGSSVHANLLLITIPAVTPTTQVETETSISPEPTPLPHPDGQMSRLLESPSTATLKLRKQPFIRVDYTLQVSLGSHVIVEVPITVHPIPIYDKVVVFRPFAAGPQPIGEPDEADKVPYKGPFAFQPMYPVFAMSPIYELVSGDEVAVAQPVATTKREVTHETSAVPNGVAELRRTVEVSTLPDGTEVVHRKEEYVVVQQYEGTIPPEEAVNGPLSPTVVVHPAEDSQQQQPQSLQRQTEFEDTPMTITTTVEVTPNKEDSEVLVNGAAPETNGHHHQHAEVDEQLTNGGHVHRTTDEWTSENGPNERTRRTVETVDYETADKDGVKVHVKKTTEHTHITSQQSQQHNETLLNGGGEGQNPSTASLAALSTIAQDGSVDGD